MKTNNIFKSICFGAASLLMMGCSNEANEPNTPSMEDFEGIVLSISKDITTRAGEEETTDYDTTTPTDNEAYISNLVVFAYPADGSTTAEKVVQEYSASEIDNLNTQGDANQTYRLVPIALKQGAYHVYVLANMEIRNTTLTASSWSDVSENDLKGASLKDMKVYYPEKLIGSSSENDKGEYSIPMSCNHADLKLSERESAIGSSNITIESKKTTSVYADLTFCMAKVRLTVLNDANSELKLDETTSDNKTEYGITLQKSVSNVGVLTSQALSSPEYSNVKLDGKYYGCPSAFQSSNATTITDWSFLDSLSEEDESGKWAWQVTCYIPERIFSSDVTSESGKTHVDIKFKQAFNAYDKSRVIESGTDSDLGVHRGVFYDIIGYTTSKDMTLLVKVKPWQYHKYTFDLDI